MAARDCRFGRIVAAVLLMMVIAGCTREPAPLRLGFVGGVFHGAVDLGLAGRNGALLAMEEVNAAGGVAGRRLELLVVDESAGLAPEEIVDTFHRAGVEYVIGPMTSRIASELAVAGAVHGIAFVSPTAANSALSGLDDNFFRMVQGTEVYAESLAARLLERGVRRAAVVYETVNREFTESSRDAFETRFRSGGGTPLSAFPLRAGDDQVYSLAARAAIALEPDAIVVVAGAVDVARFAQLLRAMDGDRILLASAEWGGTEALPELGGRAVEGLLVQQFYDRDSQAVAYSRFVANYWERFRQPPGFGSVMAYDALRAIVAAIDERRSGEDAQAALARLASFSGVQGEVRLDAYGEAERAAHLTRIEFGRYVGVRE
ncbi:MAG: ABC transporter substrate-binding protein [Rhodocyclaceae bacterium]